MKRILLWTLVAVAVPIASWVRPADAKDLKQVVTVSFSGYDDLMQGVGMIGKIAGMPGLPLMLEAQVQQAGVGEALKGLDKKLPWVVALKIDEDGEEFAVQGFLPIRDVKSMIKALPMPVEPEDAGDGVLELKAPDRSIYVKQHGAWAVVSDKKAAVVDAPGDPVKAAGGIHEKYHLGARVSVNNIPEALRRKFLEMVAFSVQAGLQQMPGESAEQFAARSKMLQQAVEQMKTTVNDLDALTLGVKLDEATSSAYLEFTTTLLADSASAKKLAKAGEVRTQFAGLVAPDAAMTLHAAQQLDAADIAQAKANMAALRANALAEIEKQGLPEDQAKLAKQLAGDMMDVVEKTLDSGKLDFAASLKLKPKAFTLVGGMQIAEGGKLESVIKRLVEQVGKENPGAASLFKLNAEEHDGVRFHVLSVPINMIEEADAREKLGGLVGDKLDVVIGIGDTKLYLAMGRDAAASLKKAIESRGSSAKPLPPAEFSVALADLLQFAASVAEDNQKQNLQMVAKILQSSPGKDHVKITGSPIPNGVRVRLTAEEGVLKAAGMAGMMVGGPAMMGGPAAKSKKKTPRGGDDQ